MDYRTEQDLIGPREVPADALWGIATLRACENFPLTGRPVRAGLIHAFGMVKLACAQMNHELDAGDALGGRPHEWPAIFQACQEMIDGRLDEHIITDALQGGAGTSTNMNVNEVLANRALQILGKTPGEYAIVDPLADINLHQSTNDTYPTSLKVAAIFGLRNLERSVVALQDAFQNKEKQFAEVVKVGRTQWQDAVLTTLGREMGAYAEAIGRDRWRVYKCEERLRVVNLGGTAIGTGLGAPRRFIFGAIEKLRAVTGLGLARAENLVEATQNTDCYVEVHGILRALATNLLKIASDLRLLSSGPEAGFGEIRLPPRQAGSSIMPGKVNPVIPEAVSQAAFTVMANDQLVAQASALGSLELNPFMPMIAESLLGSLELLTKTCEIFRAFCIEGLEACEDRCREHVHGATATLTSLVEVLGYKKAEQIADAAKAANKTIRQVAIETEHMTPEEYDELTSPARVMQLGRREKPKPKPETDAQA